MFADVAVKEDMSHSTGDEDTQSDGVAYSDDGVTVESHHRASLQLLLVLSSNCELFLQAYNCTPRHRLI